MLYIFAALKISELGDLRGLYPENKSSMELDALGDTTQHPDGGQCTPEMISWERPDSGEAWRNKMFP